LLVGTLPSYSEQSLPTETLSNRNLPFLVGTYAFYKEPSLAVENLCLLVGTTSLVGIILIRWDTLLLMGTIPSY